MKKIFKFILRVFNLQLKRYPDIDLKRRMQLLKYHNISVIFDVGANAGQYALKIRELGYEGQILSFEPLNNAFEVLNRHSLKDSRWTAYNFALGSENGISKINISQNSFSSSIKNMLPTHYVSRPDSKFINSHIIEIKKLDDIYTLTDLGNKSIMLKIDTQGYELEVLKGAREFLKKVKLIQLEMSLIQLYEDEPLFLEVIDYLTNLGFGLVSLENGFHDHTTGQLFQVDGIFAKQN